MQNSEVTQFFKLGTQVEVTSNAYGYKNSWYKATIIPQPKRNNNLSDVVLAKRKINRIWVEYDTVDYDQDHSKKFQEYTDISLIRPLPPIHNDSDMNFDKHDYVDAYHENGWFTGVILDVINDGLKYLVAFLHPYQEFVYDKGGLRVHLEWLGGDKWTKWHPSEKVMVAFCAPNVGEAVEGSLLESTHAEVSTAERAPSSARKLKQTPSGNAEGRGSSELNNAEQYKDPLQKFTISPKTEMVDFCAPNVGEVVVGSLLESTHEVVSTTEQAPSPAKKLKQATIGNAEGRDSSELNNAEQYQDSPQSFTISPKNQRAAFCAPNVGETVVGSRLESTPAVVGPAKRATSPAKKLQQTTSGNGEGRESSEANDAKPAQDAPQKFIQPCPFTPVASSKGSTHCSGKRKASDGQISSSLVFSPNSEGIEKNDDSHSRSPAKLNRVSEVDEPEKIMHEPFEEGDSRSKAPASYPEPATAECPEICPITICFSRRSDNSQAWPFTKRSNIWTVIESMEVFKKVPQMPHFTPLNELEEICREMSAISLMMNFSYVAEMISAGSPDDLNSPTIIQDTLKSLDELESHGFNITPLQVHVNGRLEKIRMEKELKGKLERVDNEIRKHQDDKAAIERKVNELTKQVRYLHEEIDKKKSAMCLQDLQLASLESQKGTLSSKLDSLLAEKPAF